MTVTSDDSGSPAQPGPTVVFDFTSRPLDEMVAGCAEDPLLELVRNYVPAVCLRPALVPAAG